MKFCINYNKRLYCINDNLKPKRGCYEMILYILELWKMGDIDKIYLYLSPQFRKELGGKRIATEWIKQNKLIGWENYFFLERKIYEIETIYYYKFLLKSGDVITIKFRMERQYDWLRDKPLYDTYYNCKYYFHYRLSGIEEINEEPNQSRLKRIVDYCRI